MHTMIKILSLGGAFLENRLYGGGLLMITNYEKERILIGLEL